MLYTAQSLYIFEYRNSRKHLAAKIPTPEEAFVCCCAAASTFEESTEERGTTDLSPLHNDQLL